jgi:hypothetical protein
MIDDPLAFSTREMNDGSKRYQSRTVITQTVETSNIYHWLARKQKSPVCTEKPRVYYFDTLNTISFERLATSTALMGVQGLWEVKAIHCYFLVNICQIIRPAGQSRSLAHIAVVDGFDTNSSSKRAFRVGIDASIWYYHASSSKGGKNPELTREGVRWVRVARMA